jgi:tRNA pseudouridine55 synthase
MFGLINIDKPRGITSRDVVNRVQRLVKPIKVGHAGTLDPLATGVLIVALGPATRLVEYVQRLPKTYLATFQLGKMSDTEDIEGEVVALTDPPIPAEEELRAVLPKFTGVITQQPPAYSALKVGGQRAYALARRGEAVELAPRPVEIHEINLVRYQYPELELLIRCGSGTYVRSLGRDIARALGTDAVMSALVRQAIGPFRMEEAVAYAELAPSMIEGRLLPPTLALGEMPHIVVTRQEASHLWQGQALSRRGSMIAAGELAAVSSDGELVAILVPDGTNWRPDKAFPAPPAAHQQ